MYDARTMHGLYTVSTLSYTVQYTPYGRGRDAGVQSSSNSAQSTLSADHRSTSLTISYTGSEFGAGLRMRRRLTDA